MISDNPKNWCGALDRPGPIMAASDPAASDIREVTWFESCIPTYNQQGESCVGQSWANWIECVARKRLGHAVIPRGLQVDGEAIWKRGRAMFWGGKLDGGLYLDQGVLAAVDLGIFPAGARPVRVDCAASAQSAQLTRTPLVVGHAVHAGWFKPSPENGCIDHAPKPTGADGYHATLRVGILHQGGIWFYAGQNSWGADWGWRGYFLMAASEDFEGAMQDSPWTCQLPQNEIVGPKFREYLVKK